MSAGSDNTKLVLMAAGAGALAAVVTAVGLQAVMGGGVGGGGGKPVEPAKPQEVVDEVTLTRPRSRTLKQEGDSYDRQVQENRATTAGVVARWTRPVILASPGLEELAARLRKRVGAEEFGADQGPTVSLATFKSNDPDLKFNWQRVIGRKIVFLFDTVDQSRLFEQLSLLQALQGFAVPDGDDGTSKWKTYVDRGKYSWGRAAHITVVLPWYRPCQMERTSRWSLKNGKWTNGDADGQWLDVPTAQYLARLLSTPGSVPPLPGPYDSLDGMPLTPLWRPPLELLFVELHEEGPISHSVSDLGATIRMERFVPYFLDKFKSEANYQGADKTFVIFPDKGAYSRYNTSVSETLRLDADHILYINKTRVGEKVESQARLNYETGDGSTGEKKTFTTGDSIVIIDDFTNSGSTLFNAVNLVQSLAGDAAKDIDVTIFVSHLVATYDVKVVEGIKEKITKLGPKCRFLTTNSIPLTTEVLKDHPQVEILDLSDFIADLVK